MATLASDNFNRADGGLGSNWTTIPGRGDLQIVGNLVQSGGSNEYSATYSAVTWPNDQWSQCVAVAAVDGGNEIGPVVRGSTSADTKYQASVHGALGGSVVTRIQKFISGSYSLIADSTATVNPGDILYLEAVGTTITLKVNGSTVASTTDTDIASGNAGLCIYNGTGTDTGNQIDDWSGGDFSGGGGVFVNPLSGRGGAAARPLVN